MRKSAVALLIALATCGVGAGQAAAQPQDPPQDGVRVHNKHERHQLSKEQVQELSAAVDALAEPLSKLTAAVVK